jgi:hypothetical protein
VVSDLRLDAPEERAGPHRRHQGSPVAAVASGMFLMVPARRGVHGHGPGLEEVTSIEITRRRHGCRIPRRRISVSGAKIRVW